MEKSTLFLSIASNPVSFMNNKATEKTGAQEKKEWDNLRAELYEEWKKKHPVKITLFTERDEAEGGYQTIQLIVNGVLYLEASLLISGNFFHFKATVFFY